MHLPYRYTKVEISSRGGNVVVVVDGSWWCSRPYSSTSTSSVFMLLIHNYDIGYSMDTICKLKNKLCSFYARQQELL